MKQLMLVGRSGCGKTTLLQCLRQEQLQYRKTQSIQWLQGLIDTPGEYMEHRKLFSALLVTCADAGLVGLVHNATDTQSIFFPAMAQSFPKPTIGIITKCDLADRRAITNGEKLLKLAGAREIYCVSATTGDGIGALWEALEAHQITLPKITGTR